MTEQPKPRRFWQIHLSTAVVLMIVAGGLIALESSRWRCGYVPQVLWIPIVVAADVGFLFVVAVMCEGIIRSYEFLDDETIMGPQPRVDEPDWSNGSKGNRQP